MADQGSDPTNIKVKFHGYTVTLSTVNDRKETPEGVVIWIKKRSAGFYQPMATIPDGTLDKFKHCRPQIVSRGWSSR